MEITLVALHGLLGQGADWEATQKALAPLLPAHKIHWIQPDYPHIEELSPQKNSLESWPAAFMRWLALQKTPGRRFLIGYSQGGRLALHVLQQFASEFDRFVIVSAQSVLKGSPEDRAQRRQNDSQWAQRFAQEPWEQVMFSWNQQNVFGGSKPLLNVSEEQRQVTVSSLQRWSVGGQKDLSESVIQNAQKIDWIVGTEDSKYAALAAELEARSSHNLRVHRVPGGHRVPLDAFQNLAVILSKIIA